MRVVRVLPDVAGIDKTFDYSVPASLDEAVQVGTRVRVVLHGRRVGGWVVAVDVEPPPGVELRPLAKQSGWGPSGEVIELAGWAAWRWAGRRSALLRAASPPRNVGGLPAPPARPVRQEQPSWPDLFQPGRTLVRLGPAADRMPAIKAAISRGPALIVLPSIADAAALARRLSAAGEPVAVMPDGWAAARAGGRSVIGARSAAWAPAPDAQSMLVLDVHDDVHKEERAPAWHVRDVLGERAARAGVPCVALSPCPDLASLAWADRVLPGEADERQSWPMAEAIDLREEDPGNGLLTRRLATILRGDGRVLCVLNRKGRARLLACTACQAVARCTACDAAVGQNDGGLDCPRCGATRPLVCADCGGGRLKTLRPGVSRLREQLAALANEPVGEVTATAATGADRRIVIGTEAVLHRGGRAETVVFLDVDQELLAPRYRAVEEAFALITRAARLTGGRRGPGRLVLQTRMPDHDVVLALVHGDPERVAAGERERRSALSFPPFSAMAAVSGAAATTYVEAIDGVEKISLDGDTWIVRAPDHQTLCDALAAAPRPSGRLRVEVDPLRL